MVLLVLILGEEALSSPTWSKEAQHGPTRSKEALSSPTWSKEVQPGKANFRNGFPGRARSLSLVSDVTFYVSEDSYTALCVLAFDTDLDTVSGSSVSIFDLSANFNIFTQLLCQC